MNSHVLSLPQEALKKLKEELVSSLADVEREIDDLGGSATTVSQMTAKSAATAKSTARSIAPPPTIREES